MAQEETKAELLRKREELMERLDKIKADLQQGLDRDYEDQAIQLENAEVLDGIARSTQAEIDRITEKLQNME